MTEVDNEYVVKDYTARSEIKEPLPEQSDRCGSEPTNLEIVIYIWCYAFLVMMTKDDESEFV